MVEYKIEWNDVCTQFHVTGAGQSRLNYIVYL